MPIAQLEISKIYLFAAQGAARAVYTAGLRPTGESEADTVAAGIDQAADDHRQRAIHPRFRTRIEHPVQPQLLGDGQDRKARAVFPAVQNPKRLRVIDGNDAFTESKLQELQLLQRAAGDAPVLRMLHLAVLAERGAQK